MKYLPILGITACLAGAALSTLAAADVGKRALTVADCIATTRLMAAPPAVAQDSAGGYRFSGDSDVVVSPDGRRYVAMLITGDLERNGNWLTLIGGSLTSYEAATQVETIARLFTSSLGDLFGYGASQLTAAHFNPIVWLEDNERVAFKFSDGREPIQIVAVNVRTKKVKRLTEHPTEVGKFAVNRDGAVLFAAKARHTDDKARALLGSGFVVTNTDVFSLARGEVDDYSTADRMWNFELFLSHAPGAAPIKVLLNSSGVDRMIPLLPIRFTEDGRYAVIDGSPEELPAEWDRYTDRSLLSNIAEGRRDRGIFAARYVKQLFVIDLEDGKARALWNAPKATYTEAAWSPDGRSLLIGPTFMPVEHADVDGRAGRAVAEVDAFTGAFRQLSIPQELSARGIDELSWAPDGTVAVTFGATTVHLQKTGGVWRTVSTTEARKEDFLHRPVRIELRQSIVTPPALYAVETTTGREQIILDLNPGLLANFRLGRVEPYKWPDREGRVWSGLLYYPVDYSPNRRFPLVIQTHGHAPETVFSLYGTGPGSLSIGLGPGFSVYAAQPLANRDIAVLQMEDKDIPGIDESPREPQLYMEAYETAVEHLVAKGLVDSERVGLVGFSRTGWHVQHALAHSRLRYAAAISSDNIDGSYLQAAMGDWALGITTDLIGTPPFGDGLVQWLQRSPALNAHKLRTPLRLQRESGGIARAMSHWEMFSRLRRLNKPVEFYVVPDIEHGSHMLQNPAQCHAAQQGAVDWFDFWLNGYEDPQEKKTEQYRRWRKLRERHEADLKAMRAEEIEMERSIALKSAPAVEHHRRR